jgi:hypothetical protein
VRSRPGSFKLSFSLLSSRFSLQKIVAVGTGHHLSCTLPMMYFFGTKPQWRLSELLFR